jgi:uncharacterized protein (DUF362 family)
VLAVAAGAGLAGKAHAAPSSPVAVARCPSYGSSVLPAMRRMFDQIGGIGKLVAGKTVAVKINMASPIDARTGFRAAWYTRWSHPDVVGAAVQLFGQAGAKRVRILESSSEDAHPLEENFLIGGWDPSNLLKAAPVVEMENTGWIGYGKEYHRIDVPGKPRVYPGFDVNHSYVECDVLVSIAKLLEHQETGVSLSMDNMVGIAPPTIYGDSAGYEEPAARPYGARTMFRTGRRQPSPPSPKEISEASPREPGYRLPRITVDLVAARPIHLAIIDGIETQTTAEVAALDPGAKRQIRLVKPGILIAGLNPVCTDAVAAAAMGFDPQADRGTAPFENCDSTLRIAEEAGLGTRDLGAIEILGTTVKAARFPFRVYRSLAGCVLVSCEPNCRPRCLRGESIDIMQGPG